MPHHFWNLQRLLGSKITSPRHYYFHKAGLQLLPALTPLRAHFTLTTTTIPDFPTAVQISHYFIRLAKPNSHLEIRIQGRMVNIFLFFQLSHLSKEEENHIPTTVYPLASQYLYTPCAQNKLIKATAAYSHRNNGAIPPTN